MEGMSKRVILTKQIEEADIGSRLDAVTARHFKQFSRAHIQRWIRGGELLLNNEKVKPRILISEGDVISINAEDEIQLEDLPQNLPLDIIWEDDHVIVLNKPAGLVVHPGAGNRDGTLVNGLLYYNQEQGYLPRAGVVHRLDKDTSGIMVVAKTEVSYLNLVGQLKDRTVKREYLAVVVGEPLMGGTIDKPLGRHPKQRTKQAVIESGREAITTYSVKEKLKGYSLLGASLKTGRTHQIRVHFSSIDLPIVGDALYGGKQKFSTGTSDELRNELSKFPRQALHAFSLSFLHPVTKEVITFTSSLPLDMIELIDLLKVNATT